MNTQVIDSRKITAPQFGAGPQVKKSQNAGRWPGRKGHWKAKKEKQHFGSDAHARTLGTRDLKLHIAILEEEIRMEIEQSGHKPQTLGAVLLSHQVPLLRAMESRLQLLRQELGARDLRDFRKGKRTVSGSFMSLGARIRWAS